MGGFDQGFAYGGQLREQQNARQEAARVAARDNYVDLQKNVLNNPNLDPNDPALNDIKDPAAKQAEIDRRVAERSKATNNIAGAFQPHESGSLFKVLSGLIHGAPAPPNTATAIASQPVSTAAPTAPETNGPQVPDAAAAPVVKDALGIPISDPAVAAAHQQPMHPMATSHPILDRFQEGLDALGNHLKGAAIGANPPQHVNDVSNLAAGYQSPVVTSRESADLAAQHAQELARVKNQNQISVAEIRAGGVRGTLNNAGAQSLGTAKALADEGTTYIDFSTGKPIDLDALEERVPDAKLVPYTQGQRLLGWQIADQKGRIITADNLKKPIGEFATLLHEPTVGVAAVPRDRVTTATNGEGGQVVTGTSSVAPVTPVNAVPQPPVATPQPPPNPVGTVPGLQRRTAAPNVIPAAPDLSAINAGIQANKGKAGAPSRKAVGPVSVNAPVVPGTISPELAESGIFPRINSLTPQQAARATKAQPAVTALLGLYGDPQTPTVKSMADFADLANSPHAQRTLGAAFKLLDQRMGTIEDPGVLATLATATGWQNFRAQVEAGVQQAAGEAMTAREKEYFDQAISSMADIIGARAATGQSAAKFSVNSIQNELPLIGTSSVTDKNSYLTKMQTISRQIKVGLNALPDNKRALKWLDQRTKELDLARDKQGVDNTPRPANVPANYVHKNGPKGIGWYAP